MSQPIQVLWNVLLSYPHTIQVLVQGGIFSDTLSVQADGAMVLSVRVEAGGQGAQTFLLEGRPTEFRWSWNSSGACEVLVLLFQGQVLASFGDASSVRELAFGSLSALQTRKTASMIAQIVAIAVLAPGLALLIFWGTLSFLKTGHLPGLVSARVVASRGDESCSSLGDYCARAYCIVQNDGPISGDVQLIVELAQGGQTPLTHSETVTIEAGQSRTVTHDFFEAELFGSAPRISCRVR